MRKLCFSLHSAAQRVVNISGVVSSLQLTWTSGCTVVVVVVVAPTRLFSRNAKVEDWSEQFTQCWDTFCSALEHLAQVRRAFALTVQMAIVQETAVFAGQHEKQVHWLITGAFLSFFLDGRVEVETQ